MKVMRMKKYLYLLPVSLMAMAAGRAEALTAADQLRETKAIFVGEFHKMDDNKDGKLSLEEYLSHQFENFRATIIDAVDFDTPSPDAKNKARDAKAEKDVTETLAPEAEEEADTTPAATDTADKADSDDGLKSLTDVNNALLEMANYELEEEEDLPPSEDLAFDGLSLEDLALPGEPEKLDKEDVLPDADILSDDIFAAAEEDAPDKAAAAETAENAPEAEPEAEPELDLSLSEEESFQQMMADITATPEEKAAKAAAEKAKAEEEAARKAKAEELANRTPEEVAERDKQIGFMLDTIKKTLPKKIDEVTTWTDIEYKDKAIAYVYQANVDTSEFSPAEKKTLQNEIKTGICAKARAEMCPRFRQLFLNDGINMRIRYIDSRGTDLSACEFNQETCQ